MTSRYVKLADLEPGVEGLLLRAPKDDVNHINAKDIFCPYPPTGLSTFKDAAYLNPVDHGFICLPSETIFLVLSVFDQYHPEINDLRKRTIYILHDDIVYFTTYFMPQNNHDYVVMYEVLFPASSSSFSAE